jgi:hypothetical protein
MNLDKMRKVVAALDVAEKAGPLDNGGGFDMQHDILYIPWWEETGEVAEMLEAAGCHWDVDGGCWASF